MERNDRNGNVVADYKSSDVRKAITIDTIDVVLVPDTPSCETLRKLNAYRQIETVNELHTCGIDVNI